MSVCYVVSGSRGCYDAHSAQAHAWSPPRIRGRFTESGERARERPAKCVSPPAACIIDDIQKMHGKNYIFAALYEHVFELVGKANGVMPHLTVDKVISIKSAE